MLLCSQELCLEFPFPLSVIVFYRSKKIIKRFADLFIRRSVSFIKISIY